MRAAGRKSLAASFALTATLAWSGASSAEVTILKTDDWEIYTQGRVNAFFSYGVGDGLPIQKPNEFIPAGGGIDPGNDAIPRVDANGDPIVGVQGRFRSMRVRSGFVPNVLGMGLRHPIGAGTTLNLYLAIWATIETESQRKTAPVIADAREGFLKVDGPWGTFTAGRFLSLFSRGATENDFLGFDRHHFTSLVDGLQLLPG